MRKQLKSIILVTLTLIFICCLCACDRTLPSNNGISNTSQGTDGTVQMELKKQPILSVNNLRDASPNPTPVLKTSFKDDEYYYYLFDLGEINNVPLEGFSNMVKHENHGQKTTHVIESSSVESSTITSTLSNTTQESISSTLTSSIKIAAEVGKKDICKVSAEYAFSASVGAALSHSYTESYTNASNFSKSKKTSVSMEFDETAANGYYGYILTGAIEVYAIVAFDISSSLYIVDYFSDIKQYWIDFYFFNSSSEFVNYDYETIPFTVPSDLPIPTTYKSFTTIQYTPITVKMTKYNCNDGNHYNKNEQEESANWRSRHDGFELGELIIYGCSKTGNVFSVGDQEKFSIKYHILQNTEDLPRVGTQLTHVSNDSETKVLGTNINERIGYGAYWVRITYNDDTQTQFNATNQFQNADSNTYIELINANNINATKSISKIEVVIAYELFAGGPGFLGIWWEEYTNWRCEYTYNFIG